MPPKAIQIQVNYYFIQTDKIINFLNITKKSMQLFGPILHLFSHFVHLQKYQIVCKTFIVSPILSSVNG